jgi:hypothetical protein
MLQAGRLGIQFPMMSMNFFNLSNPSSHTMTLGLTQPPTNLSKADNFIDTFELTDQKMRDPRPWRLLQRYLYFAFIMLDNGHHPDISTTHNISRNPSLFVSSYNYSSKIWDKIRSIIWHFHQSILMNGKISDLAPVWNNLFIQKEINAQEDMKYRKNECSSFFDT